MSKLSPGLLVLFFVLLTMVLTAAGAILHGNVLRSFLESLVLPVAVAIAGTVGVGVWRTVPPRVWLIALPCVGVAVLAAGIYGPGPAFTGLTAVTLVGLTAVLTTMYQGMPLILKEMQEQSSRRRTWLIRSVYATLAFLTAAAMSAEVLSRQFQGGAMAVLGHGRELFVMFVALQFLGVYLFLPAMVCPLITSEKERDTLQLLMLTRLSPWGILWGKLLSRLIPMLLLIAMSLPLFALAYSLGGFEIGMLWATGWGLGLTMLQVAALGLFCSTYFRTTAGAFIATYVLGILMLFGPLILDETTHLLRNLHEFLAMTFNPAGPGGWQRQFLGFHQYNFSALFFGLIVALPDGPMGTGDFEMTLLRSIPIACLTLLLLGASRWCLIRRANAPSRNLLSRFFRMLDRRFTAINARFGNIELTRDTTKLPGDDPIAWRETTRRPIGTVRYLVRLFVLIEFPVVFLCAISVGSTSGLGLLQFITILTWIIVTLFICVVSPSLISGERSYQTLDVLLTTPLTNRDILSQKTRGVRRLLFVVAVPLLTLYGFQTWIRLDGWRQPDYYSRGRSLMTATESATWYGLTGLTTVLIYLPMLCSVGFLIGMKMRNQSRAVVATLAVLVAWCLLPVLGAFICDEVLNFNWGPPTLELVVLASPMMIVPFNEFQEFHDPQTALLLNSAIYLSFLVLLKIGMRLSFANLSGRMDSPHRLNIQPAE